MEAHKKQIIFLILLLITQIIPLPGNNIYCQNSGNSEWVRKTDAPQGCVFPQMPPQIIGDKIFSLQTKNYIVDKLLIYNIKHDSWISKATSLITNRHHFATAVFNNKLFVAGGCIGDNDSVIHVRTGSMEMYDPGTDKWVSKKSLLTPRQGFQLVVYQNKIYAIGGIDIDSIQINTIEVYDPETDTWNVKTTVPWNNSLSCFGAVVFNYKIYILGESNRTNVFMVYDPNQNTFSELTPMYMDRYGYGVTLAGDEIFVVGGAQQNPVKTVAGYNITTKKWNKYPDIPETRAYPGVVQYNNKIYCIGGVGSDWNWGNPCNSVFEYEVKVKYPYASDQPIPYPKQFQIPNTSVAQSITFTPDGKSFYFVTQDNNRPVVIKYSIYTEGNWSNPKVASFCGSTSVELPFISPDGKRIYFCRDGINYCEKENSLWGTTNKLQNIDNKPGFYNYCPAQALNGNFYFVSNRDGGEKIYVSVFENGFYKDPEKLPSYVNMFLYNKEPFIAPDESYILFTSFISKDNSDLYISFHANNSWTPAINLGKRINTSDNEFRSCISPDGNYLFFTRHVNNSPRIFQIDWKPILDSLRNVSTKNKVLINQPSQSIKKTVIENLSIKTNFKTFVVNDKIYAFETGPDHDVATSSDYKKPASVFTFDPLSNKWEKKADMPIRKSTYSMVKLNDKIYVIGGFTGVDTPSSSVEEYDPVTDTWRSKRNMPTARCRMGTVVHNGKIYTFGGKTKDDESDAVEVYDPSTDTWSVKNKLIRKLMGVAVTTVNNRIFMLRGVNVDSTGWHFIYNFQEYNPATDKWTKKAKWEFENEPEEFVSVSNRLFVVGGGAFSGKTHSLKEYDLANDRWIFRSDMPAANTNVIHFSWTVLDGKIYTFGGGYPKDNHWCASNHAQRYVPETDKWEELNTLSESKIGMSVEAAQSKIFIFGGEKMGAAGQSSENEYSNRVEIYEIKTN